MNTEKTFLEELSRTPEVPPQLYGSIRRTIRRRTLVIRTVLSLAATMVLAVGASLMLFSRDDTDPVISAEAASELQYVNDFGNGSDIPYDLETYALYDGESQE